MSSKLLMEKELQLINWGSPNNPDGTEGLYYSGSNISVTREYIDFAPNGVVDFLSYFNLFNWSKWQKYTKIQNLFLYLILEGEFTLHIYSHSTPNSIDSCSKEVEILTKKISGNGLETIPVPVSFNHSIISFKLEAISTGKFYSGAWISKTDATVLCKPKIALIMVTFNRDEYLYKNLELLGRELPDRHRQPTPGRRACLLFRPGG